MGSKPYKNEKISQITENLFMGDLEGAQNHELLEKFKIKHVIEIEADEQKPKVNSLKIFINEDEIIHFKASIKKALKFLHYYIMQNKNVLVHCKDGQSNSAPIIIAYIMYAKGLNFETAKRYLDSKRPISQVRPKIRDYLLIASPEELAGLVHKS
ncbi:hypothetical protein SteCoe_35576 [Stentor coeruleus]|uniref:protein-tyrosine-phosphatase n=1 Tax=Stentor coeruleus TaxID=5963 RepID=A0A1R2ARY8_9CILI|nr:hypothetical protein SteCoe_35576 [Stentor coeruleus]